MRDGKIVEAGSADAIYADPREEYTRRLINAVPRDDLDHIKTRVAAREKSRAAKG